MIVNTEKKHIESERSNVIPQHNLWGDGLRRLFRNKIAVISLIVLLIICFACIFAPFLTKWNYATINTSGDLATGITGPTREHIFGTDHLRRDLFSRVLYGGRVTLKIALVSTSLALLIGGIIGLTAGYFGGLADFVLSPVLDILGSVPIILLALVFEIAFGWGRGYFMYAMSIAMVPQFARIARASVMNIMGNAYIEAARALGVRNHQIMLWHVLHSIAPTLIVRFTTGVADALLTCTIMGYLCIGIGPPTPEWGSIVYNAQSFIRSAPHMIIIPCAAIILSVLSINLFGDGLRDAFDPREN